MPGSIGASPPKYSRSARCTALRCEILPRSSSQTTVDGRAIAQSCRARAEPAPRLRTWTARRRWPSLASRGHRAQGSIRCAGRRRTPCSRRPSATRSASPRRAPGAGAVPSRLIERALSSDCENSVLAARWMTVVTSRASLARASRAMRESVQMEVALNGAHREVADDRRPVAPRHRRARRLDADQVSNHLTPDQAGGARHEAAVSASSLTPRARGRSSARRSHRRTAGPCRRNSRRRRPARRAG